MPRTMAVASLQALIKPIAQQVIFMPLASLGL
jgi:hypothetical protein